MIGPKLQAVRQQLTASLSRTNAEQPSGDDRICNAGGSDRLKADLDPHNPEGAENEGRTSTPNDSRKALAPEETNAKGRPKRACNSKPEMKLCSSKSYSIKF